MTMAMKNISLVPAAGETSPRSVMADIAAEHPSDIREVKQVLSYSHHLFIPENNMILGNDLIKVWNIDDELGVENQCRPYPIKVKKESATFNKVAATKMSIEVQKKEKRSTPVAMPPKKRMDVEKKEEDDEDDLLCYILKRRPSYPQSEVVLPTSSTAVALDGRASMKTVVIGMDTYDADFGMILDLDEEPKTRTAHSGQNSRHRKNHSHFDFHFQ